MSDVKVEYEQTISREDAAAWLSQLARAFTGDHDAEVPFGPGTVKLHVPETMRAELEVEVDDEEVEIEIEFKWPLPKHNASSIGAVTPAARAAGGPERANGAGQRGPAGRAKRK